MKPRRFSCLYEVLILVWIITCSHVAVSQNSSDAPGSHPSTPGDKPALVFYADPGVEARFWPPFLSAVLRELAEASPSDHLPAAARLIVAGDRSIDPGASSFIVVHLMGRCDQPRQASSPLSRHAPLGWVYESEGQIQPFVFVDCSRIAQELDPLALGMGDGFRAYAMDTAIARVLLHEWIHISLQTAEHTEHGIRRPQLSARDLTAFEDPRAAGGW